MITSYNCKGYTVNNSNTVSDHEMLMEQHCNVAVLGEP